MPGVSRIARLRVHCYAHRVQSVARERRVLVQFRVARLEREHWMRAAARSGLRVSELVRTAVRQHVLELERLRLLERCRDTDEVTS